MKNNPGRITSAKSNATDAMPQRDSIETACPLHRTMVHGKQDSVSLPQRHHHGPRLHAGPLFGQDDFTAGEVLLGSGQQNHQLQRKQVLAVEVLVQTVIVLRAILQ